MGAVKHNCFMVKGKPFFSIGGQVHNSSGYAIGAAEGKTYRKDRERAFLSLKQLGVNTAAIPVCWDVFEPEEGEFDTGYVKRIIERVREQGLHAVLLWFGTWKNGQMEYTPTWIKKDRKRFRRVICADGRETTVLSPFCRENLEKDKKAFCRLMEVIRDYDSETGTVIAVQVENEPGMYAASIRDFSKEGTKYFEGAVPEEIIGAARKEEKDGKESELVKEWHANGRRKEGNWAEVFGRFGAELCMAWATAKYIDEIAEAGRKVYDTFLYVNVWMDRCGTRGWSMAGLDYPCGGAVSKVLPVWEAAAGHLDCIAPDIYELEPGCVQEAQQIYDREDMPFYVPESGMTNINAAMMFEAVGKHSAIGYHVFGTESCLEEDGSLKESAVGIQHSFEMLQNASQLLLKRKQETEVYAFVQKAGQDASRLEIGEWLCRVCYTGAGAEYAGWVAMDYRHDKDLKNINRIPMNIDDEMARGLLFRTGDNEFYLVGQKIRLYWQKKSWIDGSIPMNMLNIQHQAHNMELLCIEEGHFENERFVIDRRRSGDEARHGIWAQYDCGVVHFILGEN